MAITIVLLLGVIFGMVALAVDAGQIYKVRTQAQNAADAAALAGAAKLNATAAGVAAARTEAIARASENRVYAGGAVVASGDVVFGRWSPVSRAFTALDESAVKQINAVQVRTTPAAVDNPFMGVVGRDDTDVNAKAMATGGGPASACSFPLVIADCLPGITGFESCGGVCLKFANDVSDNAGWSNLGTGQGNDINGAGALIKSTCSNLLPGCGGYDGDTNRQCTAACNAPNVDESIPLNNGNGMNDNGTYTADCGAKVNNPCEVIKAMLLRENSTAEPDESLKTVAVTSGGAPVTIGGRPALAGRYFTVTVPVITDGGVGTCNPKYNRDKPISGYAKVDIFGVQCKKPGLRTRAVVDQAYVEDSSNAAALAAASCAGIPGTLKHLRARVYCDKDIVAPGGGGVIGAGASYPRLVQ